MHLLATRSIYFSRLQMMKEILYWSPISVMTKKESLKKIKGCNMKKITKNKKVELIMGLAIAVASHKKEGNLDKKVFEELNSSLVKACVLFTKEYIDGCETDDKAIDNISTVASNITSGIARDITKNEKVRSAEVSKEQLDKIMAILDE